MKKFAALCLRAAHTGAKASHLPASTHRDAAARLSLAGERWLDFRLDG